MGESSLFLFPQGSAAEGAGRLLDFADSLTEYNGAHTPAEADRTALAADWLMVGEDLETAIEAFRAEHGICPSGQRGLADRPRDEWRRS